MAEADEMMRGLGEEAGTTATDSADVIFNDYMDGEVELHQSIDLVKVTADAALNAKVDALLASRRYSSVIQLLGTPSSFENSASQAFYRICQLGDAKLRHLAVLISKGADPNFRPEQEHALTPLHLVSRRHWYQAAAYLTLVGADSNARATLHQQTPLMMAIQTTALKPPLRDRNAVFKTVKKLLKTAQATIDHVDSHGFTALDYAFANSQVWVVKTLITSGATVLLSNLYNLLQSERKERTLLSTYFIDYNASDAWVHAQLLLYGTEKVCRGLVQFKMRMELRTSERTRAVQTAKEDQLDLYMRDTTAVRPTKAPAEETPKEVLASLAEQRRLRRQKSRADKAQVRHNKEQNKLEQEQEQKKLQFLKRVENEYKVSFQGLFPR